MGGLFFVPLAGLSSSSRMIKADAVPLSSGRSSGEGWPVLQPRLVPRIDIASMAPPSLKTMVCSWNTSPRRLASRVLPVPGGPHSSRGENARRTEPNCLRARSCPNTASSALAAHGNSWRSWSCMLESSSSGGSAASGSGRCKIAYGLRRFRSALSAGWTMTPLMTTCIRDAPGVGSIAASWPASRPKRQASSAALTPAPAVFERTAYSASPASAWSILLMAASPYSSGSCGGSRGTFFKAFHRLFPVERNTRSLTAGSSAGLTLCLPSTL